MQKVFITGAAGFIGSTLVDRLLADGKTVVAGGQDSVLRVWSLENGQQVRQFDPPK